MNRRVRKTLIFAAKVLVACGLLYYVLGKVHWWDYVVTTEGRGLRAYGTRVGPDGAVEVKVLDAEAGGYRWVGASEFRPVSLRTAEGRLAIVQKCRPDWRSPEDYRVRFADGEVGWVDADSFVANSAQPVRRGFVTTVRSARPALLAGAFLCFLVPVIFLSVRWWYLLRILRIRIPLWEAVRMTFLGNFFNYVVPGTVSGDLVKAYYVSRHTDSKAGVLVSVFVDRVVGLLEFAILPAAVMLVMWLTVGWSDRLVLPALVVALVLAGVAVSLGLLLSPRLRQVLRFRRILSVLPLQRQVALIGQAAGLYRRRLGALAKALGITFGGQVFFITAIMLAGMSLALPVPWHQYFLYVPLIYIIAAVPISPGGLGLAETFYVTFLGQGGAAPSEILALAVVARLIPTILSLPGVAVAVKGAKLPPAEQMGAGVSAEPPR